MFQRYRASACAHPRRLSINPKTMSDIGVSDAATVSIALNILRRSSSRQHLRSGAVCADVDDGSRLHGAAVTPLLGHDDSAH